MNKTKSGLVFFFLTSWAAVGAAGTIEVDLIRPEAKTYQIDGRFSVDASSAVVWAVLTDYDHLAAFIPTMRSSRLLDCRTDGTCVVEQVSIAREFFISKLVSVLLEVRRQGDEMRFTDLRKGDFRIYEGAWEVHPGPEGVTVRYRLRASPAFPAPSFLVKGIFKRSAKDLLNQVRSEINRRTDIRVASGRLAD